MARSLFKRLPALSNNPASNTKNVLSKANNALRSDLSNSTVKTFIPGAPLNASSNLVPPGTESARSNYETKENNVPDSNLSHTEHSNADVSVSSSSELNMPPPSTRATTGAKRPSGASTQDLFAIQEAIKRARTMDEVERLNQLLSSGQFAGFAVQWQKQLRQQHQQQQQQQAQQKAT